jgi:outer membrane protein assembly factor BamB
MRMPRRIRQMVPASVTIFALALALAGCGTAAPAAAPADQVVSQAPTTSPAPLTDADWPTYHHDNARTGIAPGFPATTKVALGWTAKLDGAVYGQPLVVGGTVYAATDNDTVYALDPQSGAVRWQLHLGTPMRRSALPCGNVDPLGITSTMVYDPATGLLFALAETAGPHHILYGLDAKTGRLKVTRSAEPPKGDIITHQERSALNILDGKVYIAYGGLAGDCGSYIGSVVGIPTVGAGAAIYYTVPTTNEAGIWTPGGATVQDGRLLYAVGNGESTSGKYDGSDSILALTPQLTLADRFAPTTWADDNAHDLDLGSMTPALVGSYIFIAGKRGTGFTVRTSHFGGVGGQVAQTFVCKAYGGAAVDHDIAYVPCDNGTHAVQIDSAGRMHVRWQGPGSANGSPVLGGGAVWVVSYPDGTLYLLDQATGKVRSQVALGTVPHFASPTLSGGRAFIGTMSGVVSVTAG